ELRDLMLRIVGVARLPDDEGGWPPFAHEAIDLAEPRGIGFGVDGAQCARDAGGGLAYRDAHAPGAEIESDDGPLDRRHACPASSERLAAFTPSAFIAAP